MVFPDKHRKTIMGTYNDLKVFNLSYDMAKRVFIISKQFPKDEIFGLTNQIRRSSRSVCVAFGTTCLKHIISSLRINPRSESTFQNYSR